MNLGKIFKNRIFIKTAVIILETAAFALIVYLFVLPLYPLLKYDLRYNQPQVIADAQSIEKAQEQVAEFKSSFPKADYAISPNRLIIAKIGVNAPIVEAKNPDYGLDLGAWRVPETSTPDKGSNTVISGHRFKYLPPNNLTFYLLDKMAPGDIISVIWNDKDYFYRVSETKIVPATEVSIQDPTAEPILTLFTCDPIYSTKNRLVVVADLAEE